MTSLPMESSRNEEKHMEFQFYMPTRVFCGAECVKKQQDLLPSIGKNAFIMTGPKSAETNGSLKDLVDALESVGMEWKLHNKVKPNPSLEEVRSAAEEARLWGADCIFALGGGSPMDAAKAVAVLAACEVSDHTLLTTQKFAEVLPLVAIPTTVGTGSEVTPYSILTNNELQTKSFLRSDQIFPVLAFLDARYCTSLPAKVTVATMVDAMSHCIEGYLAVRSTPMAQFIATQALDLIASVLPAVKDSHELSLEQWEQLLYASMLAGIVIAQTGTTAVHAMGYSLTYFKGIDHGVANGYLLPEYLRFMQQHRQADVGALLAAMAMANLDEFQHTMESLLGVTTLGQQDLKKYAAIAINAGNIKNTVPEPTEDELYHMLTKTFVR